MRELGHTLSESQQEILWTVKRWQWILIFRVEIQKETVAKFFETQLRYRKKMDCGVRWLSWPAPSMKGTWSASLLPKSSMEINMTAHFVWYFLPKPSTSGERQATYHAWQFILSSPLCTSAALIFWFFSFFFSSSSCMSHQWIQSFHFWGFSTLIYYSKH